MYDHIFGTLFVPFDSTQASLSRFLGRSIKTAQTRHRNGLNKHARVPQVVQECYTKYFWTHWFHVESPTTPKGPKTYLGRPKRYARHDSWSLAPAKVLFAYPVPWKENQTYEDGSNTISSQLSVGPKTTQ